MRHLLLSTQIALGTLGFCLGLWGINNTRQRAIAGERSAEGFPLLFAIICLVVGGLLALISLLVLLLGIGDAL